MKAGPLLRPHSLDLFTKKKISHLLVHELPQPKKTRLLPSHPPQPQPPLTPPPPASPLLVNGMPEQKWFQVKFKTMVIICGFRLLHQVKKYRAFLIVVTHFMPIIYKKSALTCAHHMHLSYSSSLVYFIILFPFTHNK